MIKAMLTPILRNNPAFQVLPTHIRPENRPAFLMLPTGVKKNGVVPFPSTSAERIVHGGIGGIIEAQNAIRLLHFYYAHRFVKNWLLS